MPTAIKIQKVEELKSWFEESGNFILADYRGLSVKQISELRDELNKLNVPFKVVKNRLAQIAMEQSGVEGGSEHFEGPTSIAFTGEDAAGAAKVLVKFEKNTPLEIKAGYVDGEFYTKDGMVAISELPSKPEILAQIAGAMEGILSRFAGDMQSVLTTFAGAVKALEDKKS